MNFRLSRWIGCRAGGTKEAQYCQFAFRQPVPEARKKLAGGETTGQARPTRPSIRCALKGRERGTLGLSRNIAAGPSPPSRAPAGAHPGFGGGGAIRFRWFPVAP